MRTCRYESAAGVPLAVEVEDGRRPPGSVVEDGVRYRFVHEGADLAEIRRGLSTLGVLQRGATSRKMHDRVFESHQLPRWDPDAPAHGPTGKPRFNGQREIDEYLAKKRHKEGLDMRYGEL